MDPLIKNYSLISLFVVYIRVYAMLSIQRKRTENMKEKVFNLNKIIHYDLSCSNRNMICRQCKMLYARLKSRQIVRACRSMINADRERERGHITRINLQINA